MNTNGDTIDLTDFLVARSVGRARMETPAPSESIGRMAEMCRAAREALSKPSDVMPTASQSAPSVLVGGSDPYLCDGDIEKHFGPSKMRLVNIEHLHIAENPSSYQGAIVSNCNDPIYLDLNLAKELKNRAIAAFKYETEDGTIFFPYGSNAYKYICQLVNVHMCQLVGANEHEPYDPEPSFVTFPMALPALDRIAEAALNCKALLEKNNTSIPAVWYNHLISLSDEAAKMEWNIRHYVASVENAAAGASAAESTGASGLVETPILTKAAPSMGKTEDVGRSGHEKMSFAAVAAIKPPTPPPTVLIPPSEPVEIELQISYPENKLEPVAIKGKKPQPKKESNVDPEGYEAPKKTAPKMEMVPHKVFPIGTSSSSSGSSDDSDSSRPPSAKSPSAELPATKIVLNLTEKEHDTLRAKIRRDKTTEKLKRRVIQRAAEEKARKEAAEKAKRQREVELKQELQDKLADYKQHLKSGRLRLRSEKKQLSKNDPRQFGNRMQHLSPFDQAVMVAFEDAARPKNVEALALEYINDRLGAWKAKQDDTMIRYWSVLASGFNGGIIDDLLYMRKLVFCFQVSEIENLRYDRIYMRIAFEGDRESRVEVATNSLRSNDPLINLTKVRNYLERRTEWLNNGNVLTEKELEKLSVIEQVLYNVNYIAPMEPIEMNGVFVDWRGLCASHARPSIRDWASGFNFMARNPHFVFATDIFMIIRTRPEAKATDEWLIAFAKGDPTGHHYLNLLHHYMIYVFGIGAN